MPGTGTSAVLAAVEAYHRLDNPRDRCCPGPEGPAYLLP